MEVFIIQSIASFANLSAIVIGILLTLRQIKLARTNKFIERYMSKDFIELRVDIDYFLNRLEKYHPAKREEKVIEILKLEEDLPSRDEILLQHQIWTFTMFFTDIGVAYNQGTINKEGIRNFNRLIPLYWTRLEPYIRAMHKHYKYQINEGSLENQRLFIFDGFKDAYNLLEDKILPKRVN